MHALVQTYGARYLVTDQRYPSFTLVHQSGPWYVYKVS